MRIDSKTLWLTKFGNEVDDYEDAFSCAQNSQGDWHGSGQRSPAEGSGESRSSDWHGSGECNPGEGSGESRSSDWHGSGECNPGEGSGESRSSDWRGSGECNPGEGSGESWSSDWHGSGESSLGEWNYSGEIQPGEWNKFRCAVADGATESSFAGLWAQLLTDGYVHGKPLSELKSCFRAKIEGKDLSWFAEEKASLGAFAALVGLELQSDGRWRAQASGDSCLFHVRQGEALTIFPLQNSQQFNNSPVLISSNEGSELELAGEIDGQWQPGDIFFLASDAIACWTMANIERQEKGVFERLICLNHVSDLEALAREQRALIDSDGRPLLRNDDLTLMRVAVF